MRRMVAVVLTQSLKTLDVRSTGGLPNTPWDHTESSNTKQLHAKHLTHSRLLSRASKTGSNRFYSNPNRIYSFQRIIMDPFHQSSQLPAFHIILVMSRGVDDTTTIDKFYSLVSSALVCE